MRINIKRDYSRLISFKRGLANLFCNLLLGIILIWVVFPFFWVISSALRPEWALFTRIPRWLPSPFTLNNYSWAFTYKPFLLCLRNSFIISVSMVVLAIIVCSAGAYSLSRYKYRGKKFTIFFLVFANMTPLVLLIIPIFIVFSKLGLVNTYRGLIFGYLTFSIPFCILLLRSFFSDFPVEIEEAALIDGCTRLSAFIRIILPLSLPAIVAVSLFCFTLGWNDLLFALILSRDTSVMPVGLELYQLSTTQFTASYFGGILAQSSIVTFPTVIIFIILQRYLIRGMRMGAIR